MLILFHPFREVVEILRAGENPKAEHFDSVTIMFSYVHGIEEHMDFSNADDVTHMLNWVYVMFDRILQEFDVYKVETAGQRYIVSCSSGTYSAY